MRPPSGIELTASVIEFAVSVAQGTVVKACRRVLGALDNLPRI